MYMSEVYVYQRTVLDALKIRKLCSFTFISPIVGHPVLLIMYVCAPKNRNFFFIWLKENEVVQMYEISSKYLWFNLNIL